MKPSTRTQLLQPKLQYVPADDVKCPEVPYFQQDASNAFGIPILTGPRVCQLCGKAFVTRRALERHQKCEHAGVAEARKRIFWHAEQLAALPLSMQRKRNMLANFDQELRCCRLGGVASPEPRRDVACVVCAQKDWLNTRFPVYLWRELPRKDTPLEDSAAPDSEDSGEASEGECQDRGTSGRSTCKRHDEDGVYYFGDPHRIDELLAVQAYHASIPSIPLQELHASAVQHYRFPDMRWLLHSRRVPLQPTTLGSAVANDPGQVYPCAGIGDEDQVALICKHCRDCLCSETPEMPELALANIMWEGRKHPLYQHLSYAMKMLLSHGRPYY